MSTAQYRMELAPFLGKSPFKSTSEGTNDDNNFEAIKSNILITANQLSSRMQGNPSILLVYSDTCGHCNRFKPEYVKLYNMVQRWNARQDEADKSSGPRNVTVYRKFNIFAMNADDDKNSDFLLQQHLRGVPTLYFISGTGRIEDYKESRDATHIWSDLQNLKIPKNVSMISTSQYSASGYPRGSYT